MSPPPVVILGAGLAGLSTSYHIGHNKCIIIEKDDRPFGHIGSVQCDGFTWDEGPHVSFTKHEYVRELFASSVSNAYRQFEVKVANYYRGEWIDHPAQLALHQVPEPLRTRCLESFLKTRKSAGEANTPSNYQEWLDLAFGPVFANTFPAAYTRKYWTREPKDLATTWVGERILYPEVADVLAGAKGLLSHNSHYITTVRYPNRGGYQEFARKLTQGAMIRYGLAAVKIDLASQTIYLSNGGKIPYARLVSTIPLPIFLGLLPNLPPAVQEAKAALSCSELLLVNVTARHVAQRPETWFYIYDEDILATRVNFTEHLSPFNAPSGCTGVQAEVYASRHKPYLQPPQEIADQVRHELVALRLVEEPAVNSCSTVHVPWANVIFDHDASPALEVIWRWLEQFGLKREPDDTHPITNWLRPETVVGHLAFAGRFGQWKYFWTDDCVLRGRSLGRSLP